MDSQTFKLSMFEEFAAVAQAFAAPKRLELLDVLAQGERDVDSLARLTGMKVTNTSRHLQLLKQARLVESRREGVRKFYRIADDEVLHCFHSLQSLAEKRSIEIREVMHQYHKERGTMEALGKNGLLEKMDRGNVIVLDLRPEEEFVQGHIAGALSIPFSELPERLSDLPTDTDIVAYCRGPYCVWSVEAMELLRDKGYQALRLQEGFPEWRVAGLPVETGDRA